MSLKFRLFVSAVSQWWISPFKMVNEYSRSPDFCLLVHKA
ncbi:rCG21313 [Rattus norvegicus]|uniref:RCG21313 n=1 Tax=Rattus norvegicus TaxID=10116 RepID=A6J280_RAT|nr:rCG21313 [Rattus norvegicus]